MCEFHNKNFILGPISSARPSSVADNLRGHVEEKGGIVKSVYILN